MRVIFESVPNKFRSAFFWLHDFCPWIHKHPWTDPNNSKCDGNWDYLDRIIWPSMTLNNIRKFEQILRHWAELFLLPITSITCYWSTTMISSSTTHTVTVILSLEPLRKVLLFCNARLLTFIAYPNTTPPKATDHIGCTSLYCCIFNIEEWFSTFLLLNQLMKRKIGHQSLI